MGQPGHAGQPLTAVMGYKIQGEPQLTHPMESKGRMGAISRKIRQLLGAQDHQRLTRISKTVIFLLLAFAAVRLAPVNGPIIEMRLYASQAGVAQWFLDSGHGYSEEESLSATLKQGDNAVQFTLPVGNYRHLRFDPIASDGAVTIESVVIKPRAQVISGDFGLADFSQLPGVTLLNSAPKGLEVLPDQGNNDPQLSVNMTQPLVVRAPLRSIAEDLTAALVLAALAWLLLDVVLVRMSVRQIVVLGLGCAFVLIVAMSAVSQAGANVHPDEPLHMSGFEYYLAHFWPPAAGSPTIVNSLVSSVWGVSYLNNYDVVYFIAGHLMAPFAGMFSSPLTMARTFQNLLWLVLIGFALRKRAWAMALAALLISPQIWYIFSYFNGDAFPLFLCSVAVMLVCDRGGGLARYLSEGGRPTLAAVAFSLCVGLTLVSKANFLPVVMGLFLWIAVQHMRARWLELGAAVLMVGLAIIVKCIANWGDAVLLAHVRTLVALTGFAGLVAFGSLAWRYATQMDVRPAFHRGLVLLMLALMFASPRIANDRYINGGSAAKGATITAMREKYAGHDFKPSVIASGGGYPSLQLASKGVSLGEMLVGSRDWIPTTAKSAFGTYGYMDIWAPVRIYWFMWICFLVLVGASGVTLVWCHDADGAKLLFIAIGTCTLILGSSILFSWLYAFQAQGRYLIAMTPMLALVVSAAMPSLPPRFTKLILAVLLVLSAWSFVQVGLPAIAARAG